MTNEKGKLNLKRTTSQKKWLQICIPFRRTPVSPWNGSVDNGDCHTSLATGVLSSEPNKCGNIELNCMQLYRLALIPGQAHTSHSIHTHTIIMKLKCKN